MQSSPLAWQGWGTCAWLPGPGPLTRPASGVWECCSAECSVCSSHLSLQEYWPLTGPEWSHDLDTGLWLALIHSGSVTAANHYSNTRSQALASQSLPPPVTDNTRVTLPSHETPGYVLIVAYFNYFREVHSCNWVVMPSENWTSSGDSVLRILFVHRVKSNKSVLTRKFGQSPDRLGLKWFKTL